MCIEQTHLQTGEVCAMQDSAVLGRKNGHRVDAVSYHQWSAVRRSVHTAGDASYKRTDLE